MNIGESPKTIKSPTARRCSKIDKPSIQTSPIENSVQPLERTILHEITESINDLQEINEASNGDIPLQVIDSMESEPRPTSTISIGSSRASMKPSTTKGLKDSRILLHTTNAEGLPGNDTSNITFGIPLEAIKSSYTQSAHYISDTSIENPNMYPAHVIKLEENIEQLRGVISNLNSRLGVEVISDSSVSELSDNEDFQIFGGTRNAESDFEFAPKYLFTSNVR